MSTRGLLVRFCGGMAIGIAAIVLVMGCAAAARKHARHGGVLAAGQERGSWSTPPELAWLHRLGVWEGALMRSLDRAAHARTEAAAARLVGPIRSCTNDLHESAGDAPTARLGRVLRMLEEACAHLEDAVTTTSTDTAEREGHRGGDLLLRADELLPPGETRPLPVISRASVESHIDPKFSRIASGLAGKDVQVRCWSRVDWTRLMREEKAYTLHHIDDETLGFAGINGTRDSYAIQVMKDTAVKLGVTTDYASELQSAYWARYDRELPAYRSPECRNGGAYDLRKADPSLSVTAATLPSTAP